MFKKILIWTLVLSPLIWTLLVGYPVKQGKRNWETDNFSQYLSAFKKYPKLRGKRLLTKIMAEIYLLFR